MKSRVIERWVEAHLAGRRISANSLIISVYGDLIAMHGGVVWLADLIRLMAPFGLNERVVRTSVYRLVQEGWLESGQVGRRSYYRLAASGIRRFAPAWRRIYEPGSAGWSGTWQVVMLPSSLEAKVAEGLRRELSWAGYGSLNAEVLLRPTDDASTLRQILDGSGLRDRVVPLTARGLDEVTGAATDDLVRECWDLQAIAATYDAFIEHFRPLVRPFSGGRVEPQQAFLVQTLLIHEFRRVLLHDPQLPAEVMPIRWRGDAARLLCARLYRLSWYAAVRHLQTVCATPDGPLPPPSAQFFRRFGGLEAPPAAMEEASTTG
ncbi:MAG TPA: phenylacetic acid degradation operon negative regulatory protein PaaX [Azoarcus taiwanensis]|nr:phenylacetic acid degradation operon negative regulatory protein PaaX [Azoarcus taiwanensis]